jgi:HlyD family secretion protein
MPVTCLGKLFPDGGVVQVAAPYAVQGPSIVNELKVKEGDWVQKGQLIAVTHYRAALAAAAADSEAKVEVARRKLKVVEAGQKAGDVAAQRAEMQRMQNELQFQESDFKRQEELFKSKAVSASEFERARANLDNQKRLVDFESQHLQSISEIRDVDIALAKAEVAEAEADLAHARAELDQTQIRAPQDGEVLKILTRAGESAAARGVVEMANTHSLLAVAEVYETDVQRVRVGQKAEITSATFAGKIAGKVEHIGRRIERNELAPIDPSAYSNLRVVEVRIRLEPPTQTNLLVSAQVTIRIQP